MVSPDIILFGSTDATETEAIAGILRLRRIGDSDIYFWRTFVRVLMYDGVISADRGMAGEYYF